MRFLSRISVSVLLASAMALAQPSKAPQFTSSPSIEDRNLYYAFFNAQQAVFTANQAARTSSPAGGAEIDRQTAATLHISVPDLAIVASLVQQATQGYAQVPALRQSHVAATSKLKLTPAQISGIEDYLRLDVTARAVFALAGQLPAASWTGLHGYIVGDFKKTWQSPQPKP